MRKNFADEPQAGELWQICHDDYFLSIYKTSGLPDSSKIVKQGSMLLVVGCLDNYTYSPWSDGQRWRRYVCLIDESLYVVNGGHFKGWIKFV
jgi:hypothetical protein